MSLKTHIIALGEPERSELEKRAHSIRRSIREKTRARILLLCDAQTSREAGGGCLDREVATLLGCNAVAVAQVRKRACKRAFCR